jgi:hypothetical protein
VTRSIAPEVVEIDCIEHPTAARGFYRVAYFVHAARYRKSLPGITGHLWHKRHFVERRIAVQRREDFSRRPYLNNVARP